MWHAITVRRHHRQTDPSRSASTGASLLAGLGLLAALVAGGCVSPAPSQSTDGCTEGRSTSCGCPDGSTGVQTCRADQTWEPCDCGGSVDAAGGTDAGATPDAGEMVDGSPTADTGAEPGDWSHPSDRERTLVANRQTDAISVDGRLDEPTYQTAHRIEIEDPSGASDNRTRVRASWDAQTLYVGFEVEDAAVETPDAPEFHERDGIQMYLDRDRDREPNGLRTGDYNVIVDAAGRTLVEKGTPNGQVETDAVDVEAAARETSDGYTLELAIPWGDLGAEPTLGQRMGFFVANHDRDDGELASYGWGVRDGFGYPSKWGDLRLGPKTAADAPNLEEKNDDDGSSHDGGGGGDWKTPYPSPPDDAIVVGPDEARSAIADLQPGDTLVLENGTYPHFRLDGVEGTAERPITIMAENERQPIVRGDGYEAALRIVDSSYIRVKGIVFENVDVEVEDDSDIYGAMAISVSSSDHITLWRNIARHPNLYGNNTAVKLNNGTTDSLVAENEVYDFHRNGIAVHNGTGETGTRDNVLRRNYINPRDTLYKGNRWGPNYAIACYRAVDTIVENNIVHYSQESGETHRNIQNPGAGNEFYGNITIEAKHGFGNFYHDTEVEGLVMENNLVVDPKVHGLYTHSIPGFVARNNTIINPGDHGFRVTDRSDRNPDFTSINNLVIGAGDSAYDVSSADQFTSIEITHSGGWNNDAGTWGAGTDDRSNVPPERDPQFDETPVYIPDDSPYAGAGKDGADIGANILYRYKNGELTDKPLWNPETGEFPHGAVVEGINDQSGHSAFDVHNRLDVRPATLPDDY